MPSVDELIEQVCRETGLDDTSGTEERALALSSLNRARRRLLAELDQKVETAQSFEVTPVAVDVSLSANAPTLLRVNRVARVSDDREVLLDHLSPDRLRELRAETAEGVPSAYAVEGDMLLLDGFDSSTVLRVGYTGTATAMAEGGAEASIDIMPIYHEDLLATLAVVYVLEGYEGEEERAATFRRNAQDALFLYKKEMVRRGGERLARVDDIGRWDTPGLGSAR